MHYDLTDRYEANSDVLYRPSLSVIESQEITPFQSQLDRYLFLRNNCLGVEKASDEDVLLVQGSVRDWINESGLLAERQNYSDYDYGLVNSKIGALISFLQDHHPDTVTLEELETSESFVETVFSTYEESQDLSVDRNGDGSFAFVVPARMSRSNTEYGEEVEPAIPAFRYVPRELRAQMMIGVPPFVIDTYEKDADGRNGYLVFSPIFPDMLEDLDPMQALEIARQHVNDAVNFSQSRFGVKSVGLGAVLPALTRFGKDIANEEVIVTTGHGGTAHLVKESVREAVERGYVNEDALKNIGILGLGSIGSSIAELIATEYPDTNLRIYDTNTRKIKRTADNLSSIIEANPTDDEASLIEESSIVISAITTKLALRELGVNSMSGKMVIDDSQPGSFDPNEVEELGGSLTWVIGRDSSNSVRRGHYDYGTMVDPSADLFGCEAEAAILAGYHTDLIKRGFTIGEANRLLSRVAVQEPVRPSKARLIGGMMRRAGIGVSDFQALGRKI